jgi:hypothetical protein
VNPRYVSTSETIGMRRTRVATDATRAAVTAEGARRSSMVAGKRSTGAEATAWSSPVLSDCRASAEET